MDQYNCWAIYYLQISGVKQRKYNIFITKLFRFSFLLPFRRSDAMNEKTLFKIIQLDEKFSESPMKKANYLIRQSIYIEKRKFIQYFAEEIIGTATRYVLFFF